MEEHSTQAKMPPLDIAMAVKEIAKGHRQMSLLRAVAAVAQRGGAWPQNAEALFDGVMESLAAALSTLNPVAKGISHRHPDATAASGYPSESNNWRNERPTRKREGTHTKSKNDLSRKRRMLADSQIVTTSQPMDDAYQWRKYGEKKIHGAQFPRCYYRCAYRGDEGCQAVKQVQQADNSNPPMFIVTNIGRHTCTMAEISHKRGFAIVASNSPSSCDMGSTYFGVQLSSCASSASPVTEETPELDMAYEERRPWSPEGYPAQQAAEGREQVEVMMDKELSDGASDISDMISSMLCPMSPYSMHLEMTMDPASLGDCEDLWLL